jgi:predicted dehydrogenase
MNQVKIGVLGVGWWGTVGHLQPLSEDPKAEVVAVWSRTEGKARERAAQFGVPRHYTDYRALIDAHAPGSESALDAVTIASTPNMHYEQARYALEHGLHVLMEKPFVLQAAQAEHLERLARERDLRLSVCHPLLYHPIVVRARDELRGGAVGQVLLVTALFSQRVYDLYKGQPGPQTRWARSQGHPRPNLTSYSDPAVVGGGEGHTQASHIVGALLWLTGLRPTHVFARMNALDVQVDVVNAMTVLFEGGALATVGANGMLPRGVGSSLFQVQGVDGILGFDPRSGGLYVQDEEQPRPRAIEVPAAEGRSGIAAVPRNFVRAILGEEEQHVATEVAIDEVRVLDAAYRSAASGREIEIEREE